MGTVEQARATDAMMVVSRTLTAVVARTLAEVSEEITVPQLRVLDGTAFVDALMQARRRLIDRVVPWLL